MTARVAVVGAGAIGLSVAWRLLARGARVDVYERDAAARGASWASAGLLAPTAGHGGPAGTPLDALCRAGMTRWPGFASELADASGVDVALRTEGTLVVALDDAGAERLRAAFDAWRAAGDDAQEWLEARDVAALEPALASTAVAARRCPGDHQVDSRRLVRALDAAVRRAGGVVRDRSDAALDAIDADVIVLAAGAWSAGVAGAPRLAVRPVKGQMIALGTHGAPPLRHVVFAPNAYLVPRDGRLLVGATVEEAGFDDAVTDAATRRLRAAAESAAPALARAPVVEAWAGLRPMTPDGAPLLGALDARVDARTLVATGHGRNGILLAPLTGDLIADLALGAPPPAWLAAFSPWRFER